MTPEADVVTHLESLGKSAEAHDKTCHDTQGNTCTGNRIDLVAQLMTRLGLDLADIGFIAEAWLDIQCDADESLPDNDSVLDAKEIGE